MSRTAETGSYILIGVTAALCAAILASLITIWVKTYEPEPARPQSQLFDGFEVEALARLGVEKLEVKKVHSMGGTQGFQLKLHRAGEVTGYRGFYPDTVSMVIDILPEGQAKANYTSPTLNEFHEDHLRQIGEFFLVQAIDVAHRIQAFDGMVLGRNSMVKTPESMVRE